jgi:hypothetical protein
VFKLTPFCFLMADEFESFVEEKRLASVKIPESGVLFSPQMEKFKFHGFYMKRRHLVSRWRFGLNLGRAQL